MHEINRNEFISSTLWKMLEAFSMKGISVIISIVLARLLLPENYGIVGITGIFISFSTILVQSGINTSLIRKDKVDDQDYSNAFFFCLAIATLCYLVFFVGAPKIAAFYDEPLVTNVLRMQMLSLFLCALGTVRNAIIVREFKFKQLCLINLAANIIGGVIGIYIAFAGGGVWALVFYSLLRDGASTLLLFFFVRWKLVIKVSLFKLKSLVSFSVWVLISSLLDFFGNNLYTMLIGKHYSLADLGYYGKGRQLPEIVCLYVFGAFTSVLLPALSQTQNDIPRLKGITKKVTRISTYAIFPMMMGLATVGKRLIPLLFSEKWVPCIPIFYASCLVYAVNPCRAINIQLLYAKGKSKSVVVIEIVRFTLLLTGLIAGVYLFKFGIVGLAFVQALVAIINTVITQLFIRRLSDYSFLEWIKDQAGPFMMCIVMGAVVLLADILPIPSNFVILVLQVIIGVSIYIFMSAAAHIPEYEEIKGIVANKVRGLIHE